MTHHSDIIKPSASTEPIRTHVGSDSSIKEADWDDVWREAAQGQMKGDGNSIFMAVFESMSGCVGNVLFGFITSNWP